MKMLHFSILHSQTFEIITNRTLGIRGILETAKVVDVFVLLYWKLQIPFYIW